MDIKELITSKLPKLKDDFIYELEFESPSKIRICSKFPWGYIGPEICISVYTNIEDLCDIFRSVPYAECLVSEKD